MPTPLPDWLAAFRARLGAEVVDTHISWLLLTGDFVWKLKKPLVLPFLDYGSTERRRLCCEEELRLNRRFAPDLYLGVEAVGDSGEWAVKMRRFPEAQRLDHVCARGELGLAQLGELARVVHAFQASAAVAGPDTPFGEADEVLAQAVDNFTELFTLTPAAAPRLAALAAWTRDAFARIRPHLRRRKASGRVRECHGDLHLGNLVLVAGRVTPFDCIEFSDRLRWIDVASEIAFTFVDLLDHRRADLAGWLLNEWLTESGDFDAMTVLRFYAVYRAMVRAKVAALGGEPDRAEDYLRLAESLAAPPVPRLTITFGLSGSGKTTASGALLRADPRAATLRLRSDVERKRLFGLSALADSRATTDANLYTADANRRTYAQLADTAAALLTAGWSVIVDAAFLKRSERDAFRALATQQGAGFAILACSAPADELRQRLQARQGDASEATVDVLDKQFGWVEELGADEIRWVVPPPAPPG